MNVSFKMLPTVVSTVVSVVSNGNCTHVISVALVDRNKCNLHVEQCCRANSAQRWRRRGRWLDDGHQLGSDQLLEDVHEPARIQQTLHLLCGGGALPHQVLWGWVVVAYEWKEVSIRFADCHCQYRPCSPWTHSCH